MVYIRLPNFKTAIQVSAKHRFAQDGKFTPTQKLMLARNRIWGNIVGGTERSGYKELKKPLQGAAYYERYENAQFQFIYPQLKDWGKYNLKKEKYQSRKLRIFMRGMKIGQQKGVGKSMDGMAMFEMANKKGNDPALG